MRFNVESLRVRLALWYFWITVAWMLAFGTGSYLYLRHTLASARSATLQRRTDRLVRFLRDAANGPRETGTAHELSSEQLTRELHLFSIVAPESDLLQVVDAETGKHYQRPALSHSFAWPAAACLQPCFRLVDTDGWHMRLLQQTVDVNGRHLHVSMAGQVDEHDNTLRMVLQSYLVLLPLTLIGSVSGGLLLGARALRPVGRLTRAASSVSIQNLSHRLPVPHTGDEVQQLAEAWNDLLSRLEAAVRQLQQFTGDISHDLRTAVTVMLATAEISLTRERTPAEYQEALRTVVLECQATSKLLDDLLAASRVSVAGVSFTTSAVPLSEVVEEACEQFRGRMTEKSQHLFTSIAHDQWTLGDPSLLRRLTVILLDNAAKYTPEGKDIHVSLNSRSSVIELEVSDTGIGMKPAILEKIFDRFYRADTSRNRDSGGNGLGLAIAKWVAEIHGGKITVMSTHNVGSRFTVALPAMIRLNGIGNSSSGD